MASMPVQRVVADLRELATMRRWSERAASLAAADKPVFARKLRRLAERRRAAEVLWANGCPAQAVRMLGEASVLAGELAAPRTIDALLRDAGLDDERARAIADGAAADHAPPELDLDVDAEAIDAFPERLAGVRAIERALEPYALDRPAVQRRRVRRAVTVAALAALAVAALVLIVELQFHTHATASASYGPKYEAPNVLDASPESEWLLPNDKEGWLDLHLSPARTVSRLRIINAHNNVYNDRATHDFRIELYRHDHLLKSLDESFPAFSETPDWTTFEVGKTPGVDRVRIVIKSWFKSGGGLCEVRAE